jgi:tetratricopeptide (TPR) repeat protein
MVAILCALVTPAGWTSTAQWVQTPPEVRARDNEMSREYLSGDADAAVEYFARRLRLLPAGTGIGITNLLSFDPDAGQREPRWWRTILVTEVLMQAGMFGRYASSAPIEVAPSGVGLDARFELNSWLISRGLREIVVDLRKSVPPSYVLRLVAIRRAKDLEMIRSWYVLAVSYCQRWKLDAAQRLLAAAVEDFPDEPEILLLDGAMAESERAPSRAETALRAALARDPSLVEARVRLGRLLLVSGRDADARRELTAALGAARAAKHDFGIYFAAGFLADLDDRAGRAASARQLRAEAARHRTFAADPLFKGLTPVDLYNAAQFYQHPARVRALREAAR